MLEAVTKAIDLPQRGVDPVGESRCARSIAAACRELSGAICASTPSIAPGVVEAMADIAPYERSVSAAGLVIRGGAKLGSFNGPAGVFADSRGLAAELYGGEGALVLVGGSTSGNQIISKLLAARGATVLTAANAHHSMMLALTTDGVDFNLLEVGYDRTFEAALAPTASQIGGALRLFPQIDAVCITSPSYEGEIADIASIAETCHAHGAILIVDAAWGAHHPYHPVLPDVPCALGADIAVTSLHKLGGGPQGTAVLTYRTERVTPAEIDNARMQVVTTSPSMVLLGGADAAMREMAARGASHLERTFALADELVDRASADLPKLETFQPRSRLAQDPTRITFATHAYAMPGHELARALARKGIVCEKASTNAITFLMAMGLPDDAPQLIINAMREALLSELRTLHAPSPAVNPFQGMRARPACTPGLARKLGQSLGRPVPLGDAAGWIATEMIEVYPPGIPVIVPGFRITRGAIEVVHDALRLGADVQSTGSIGEYLTVISRHALHASG